MDVSAPASTPPSTSASAPRTLTVGCRHGLANRLRVLASGLAWERLTGRRFTLLWPTSAACAAPFDQLFMPVPAVQPADDAEVRRLSPFGGYVHPTIFDIGMADAPDLRLRTPGWLVPPRLSPVTVAILRWLPGSPAPFTAQHADVMREAANCLAALRPVPSIQARIDAFTAAHFRTPMVGLHIRRGDFGTARSDGGLNINAVLSATRALLRRLPEAGVFIATDDGAIDPVTGTATPREDVVERIARALDVPVVTTTPRSLDRRDPVAIEDALVDLWLLRQTSALVGTPHSSFSELGVFGRDVPRRDPRAPQAGRWLRRVTLFEPLVIAAGFWQFGRPVPYAAAMAAYQRRWHQRRSSRD